MKVRLKTFYFALAVLAVSAIFPSHANANPAAAVSLKSIASELFTPETIARFIFKNFVYTTDRAQFGSDEKWQTPEELLANRQGDCEDFAFFASEMLKANGVSAFLVNVYGKKFAHTVCVFKQDGKYHVLDGKEVKLYGADSLQELFSEIYPHWNEAALVGYSSKNKCGRVLKTFQNK